MEETDELPEIHAALYAPPATIEASPPITPRQPALPLGQLSWETFERLCLRVAAQDVDARYARLYGRAGQKQDGIDVYVRLRSGKYAVWQSKRYEKYSADKVKKAVNTFLDGKWVKTTETFTLCVKASLQDTEVQDEIERQAQILAGRNIALIALDGEGLSARLKALPEIIDDFFGRVWVKEFCGEDIAEALAERLPAEEAQELRQALRTLYLTHFHIWDSGAQLPAASHDGLPRQLPLIERFIEPDIYDKRAISHGYGEAERPETPAKPSSDERTAERRHRSSTSAQTEVLKSRAPAFGWIAKQDWCVVLGDAGSGKSTLLRVLAMEILAEAPRCRAIQARWAGYLPIWLPFSFWTESIASTQQQRGPGATLARYLRELEAPERLQILVERALRDGRLLLLIDGLDEWTDETAGRTAVGLLRAFVDQHPVAAIVTSRPLGFQRLAAFDDRWQRVELAPLSQPQQQQLAYRWFAHLEQGTSAAPEPQAESAAKSQSCALVADLNRHPALSALAGIPLLLWGLIALRASHAQLPRNRFAAYELLTELLLHQHPNKRREAALARTRRAGLSPGTQDDALARLAHSALEDGEEAALDESRAKDTLVAFLREHLDLPRHDALARTEELLDVGAEAAGVLIRKASRHLGFLHRAFLEFLAARHVVQLDLAEQSTVFSGHCGDPQWFDTLLSVLYLTRRPSDAAALVEAIERTEADDVGAPLRQRLLAEIAFGDFRLPPKLAKRLARDAFTEIETGTWMPLRRSLLSLAVDGLQSDALRTVVESRIQRWFPDRHRYRSGVYEAVGGWPSAPETLELLWDGILNGSDSDRIAAASSLATVFGEQEQVGKRLDRLLRCPADSDIHAAALQALTLGWPSWPGIEGLIADARESIIPDLRLVAIRALIAAGRHSLEDRDELLALATLRSDLSYHRKDALADALVVGWPGDTRIKEQCLKSWGIYRRDIDHSIATAVLLRGYPKSTDVIDRLAFIFKKEEHLTTLSLATHLLPNIFPNASDVLEQAIEQWIADKTFRENDIAYASLAIRTPATKARLLAGLAERTRSSSWFVGALLDGWGMEDAEVAAALTQIARASGIAALPAVPRMADILPDRDECRQRLLDLVRHPECRRGFHLVATGLKRLEIPETDGELLDALLDLDLDGPVRWFESPLPTLMRLFPDDPRVRVLAKKELAHWGDHDFIASVASAYACDASMRQDICEALSPLPPELRQLLAERLAATAHEDEFALAALSSYEEDGDDGAKTTAAIGYFDVIAARQGATEAMVEKLRDGLHGVGSDYEGGRQATFAALLSLRRLDVFLGEKARYGDGLVKLLVRQGWRDNSVFLRRLAARFEQLAEAFGDEDWARLGIQGGGFTRFGGLATYAAEGSALERETIRAIEAAEDKPLPGGILAMLARARPGSAKLRQLCLFAITSFHDRMALPDLDDRFGAASLLGAQFAGNDDLLERLASMLRESDYANEAALIALCTGWSHAESTSEAIARYRQEQPHLHTPTYFHVAADQLPTDRFVEVSLQTLSRLTGSVWDLPRHCAPPIVRRLRENKEARDGYLDHLLDKPQANAKASIPGLLVAAAGLSEDLRDWSIAELKGQFGTGGLAEHGVDLVTGTVRPVAHALLDLFWLGDR